MPVLHLAAGFFLRALLGLVIGFSMGMTGIGGAVLTLPALTLVLRMSPSAAVGTTSLYMFLTNTYSTYRHFRLKTVDARTAGLFLCGGAPAAALVAALVNARLHRLAGAAEAVRHMQHSLHVSMVAVMLLSATLIATNLAARLRQRGPTPGALAARLARRPRLKRGETVALGAVVGALVGATSIGGGIIIIALLILVLGFPAARTVGTSILCAWVLTCVTAVVYGAGGSLNPHTAIAMTCGSLVGVHFGSRLTVRIPELWLQAVVVAVIFLAAALMLTRLAF